MKISLILPTVGRREEVVLFLESLKKQTYRDFELIMVDQNKNDELKYLVEEYSKYFEIKYIKNNVLGISINRNKGLIHAKGDIIAFPDDDCEYDPLTLERVVAYLYNSPKTIYSCRTLERNKNYGTGIMLEQDAEIDIDNVEETVKSITFFVNITNEDLFLFDVKLGVGSTFGSGEETDYILNLLHNGYKGKYFANHIIYHPAKKGNYDDIERAYNYALGYGAMCKKEISLRKNKAYIFKFLKKIFRNLGAMIITKNRKYHYYVLKGRLKGFFSYD